MTVSAQLVAVKHEVEVEQGEEAEQAKEKRKANTSPAIGNSNTNQFEKAKT